MSEARQRILLKGDALCLYRCSAPSGTAGGDNQTVRSLKGIEGDITARAQRSPNEGLCHVCRALQRNASSMTPNQII